ncbi:MAG: hypothetical protein EPN82_13770, partial [Bacteroidetes bacterium]
MGNNMKQAIFFFSAIFIIILLLFPDVLLSLEKDNLTPAIVNKLIDNEKPGFWENKGQLLDHSGVQRNDVLFYHTSGNMNIYLKSDGVSYVYRKVETKDKIINKEFLINDNFGFNKNYFISSIQTHRVDLQFISSNPNPEIIKEGESDDYNNFYYAHLGENGLTFVHHYNKITYKNIYPNIDFVYYFTNENSELNNIKYDLVVKPGGNISSIKIQYTGADNVSLSENGSLIIKTSLGNIEEAAPFSFIKYNKNSETTLSNLKPDQTVNIKYKLENNILSFTEANYDKSKDLIIDPRLIWGTYYGGDREDDAFAVVVDKMNNIVVTGYTTSFIHLASNGAFKTTGDTTSSNAFIVKLDSTGKRKWCTYYGGVYGSVDCAFDFGTGIGCLRSDNSIVVAGITYSDDSLATPGAYQTTLRGETDVFLARFDSNGVRKWATYYGGDSTDGGISEGVNLCINNKSDILLTGWTKSPNGIATPGAYKTVMNSNTKDAFIASFDTSGNRKWGTYFGINGVDDYGTAIASDQFCNIYITGTSKSKAGLATPGTHQDSSCDSFDAFVAKFDSSGVIKWSTYYGGCDPDLGCDVFPDGWGNVIITGATSSLTEISTPNSMQPVYGGGTSDAFIAKLDTSGKRIWGTYYGGSGSDIGLGLTQDRYRNIVLTGITSSANNIATICTHKSSPGGGSNQFLSKFGPDGSIQWGTYYCDSVSGWSIGGSDIDIDKNGDMIIVGGTRSWDDVATPGAYQTQIDTTTIYSSDPRRAPRRITLDAFIAKFGPVIPPSEIDSKDDEIQYASVCLTAGPVIGPYCVGQEIVVPFKTYVNFNPGNIFTAKLSNKF